MIESLSLHGITRLMSISCSSFANAKLEFHIKRRERRMMEGEQGMVVNGISMTMGRHIPEKNVSVSFEIE